MTPIRSIADDELLGAWCSERSQEAFAEIVRRHGAMVYATCLRRLGGRPALAEDAAQTVFVALMESAGKIRSGRALASWLFRAAGFTCRNIQRAEYRRIKRETKAAEMTTQDQPERPDTGWDRIKEHLDRAVDELPARQRDAVLLYYLEGRTQAEIARERGCSESTIRARIRAGLERLRRRLARQGALVPGIALGDYLAKHAAVQAPARLLETAALAATGQAAGVSGQVAALTHGLVKSLLWAKLKVAAAWIAAASVLLGGGVGVVAVTVREPGGRPPRAFFVDQSNASAADRNPGTEDRPFRTVARGVQALRPGDTLLIGPGTYKESVRVAVRGSRDAPVVIKAAGADRPVLSGNEPVTGWRRCTSEEVGGNANFNRIRVADLEWRPSALFLDGREQPFAREPNAGTWICADIDEQSVADPVHLPGLGIDLTGATVLVYPQGARVVARHDTGQHRLFLDSSIGPETGHMPEPGRNRYCLFNRPEFIDQPGEWAYRQLGANSYRLYFWPPDGEVAAAVTLVPRLECLMDLSEAAWCTVDGLEFVGTAPGGPACVAALRQTGAAVDAPLTLRNCVVRHAAGAAVRLENRAGATVRNNLLFGNRRGIVLNACRDVTVEANEIAHSHIDGLVLGYQSRDIVVRANYIHHCEARHPDCVELHQGASGITLDSNVLVGASHAVMMRGCRDVRFVNNVMAGSWIGVVAGVLSGDDRYEHGPVGNVEFTRNTLAFGGGVLGIGRDGRGLRFRANICCNGTVNAMFRIGERSDYRAENNVYFHGPGIAPRGIAWAGRGGGFEDYVRASGQDAHSLYADPLFVNAPTYSGRTNRRVAGETMPTPTRSYVLDNALFEVGDHIEIDTDGVVRTVTAKGADGNGEWIAYVPPATKPIIRDCIIWNWKERTDFTLDLGLLPGSPAANPQNGLPMIGSSVNMAQYAAGDFDGDGRRDIPRLPASLLAPPQPEAVARGR